MRLADIVSFRRDLLFNGAVQLDWLETNPELAEKAALHYAFHGPAYHGVVRDSAQEHLPPLVDTASFTLDVVEKLTCRESDEAVVLAVAGYGTGKSHLAITLASLLGAPGTLAADGILSNLSAADKKIGDRARRLLAKPEQPFLVIALNGMKNFDLTDEIRRQVFQTLKRRALDDAPLKSLRPRFIHAKNFVESFFEALKVDFARAFGELGREEILSRLDSQDEGAFDAISAIYELKMGAELREVGRESLQDFVQKARDVYCGEGKPFAGILILFDEFGRYLEFAVLQPKLAGAGGPQQLLESVQANADKVFLTCFIQYEPKTYISRIAPERRDDLQRYVTRYDAVRKVRLSTNLETLIANLFEKLDAARLKSQVAAQRRSAGALQAEMKEWFPELTNHAVWSDLGTFTQVVIEGCWPLHPLSTWLLYKLASAGRTLQQRSALSLLADAYTAMADVDIASGFSIAPTDLCSDGLVDEFASAERFGQQGASAQSYRSVLGKFGHQLSDDERRALQAVLLLGKTGARTRSRQSALLAIALFSGASQETTTAALRSLESERGALSWNEALQQYEIVSDAVPRAQFFGYLESRVKNIRASLRAKLFSENYARWFPDETLQYTDFGDECDIKTSEWNYATSFADVQLLPNHIELALRNWTESRAVDEPKGQLIYCYVGLESDLSDVREATTARLRAGVEKAGLAWQVGAPLAVVFLHDKHGTFGAKIAEYWTLQQSDQELQHYASFLPDRKTSVEQELRSLVEGLQRERSVVFASEQEIKVTTLRATLTQLFRAVYPNYVPFPFDGFSTAAGNAASDCALFTRQLFLGHFDREWITAQTPRAKNRAHEVLINSWKALDNAGALRILPGNPSLRRIMDVLEAQLPAQGNHPPLNMGRALRTLCAPPVGCNLASAGLALALFVGARKNVLGFQRGTRAVSTELWLQEALPRNFLDLSVLDATNLVQISAQEVDEWSRLLNAWEIETTHLGKLEYWRKAEELKARLPVPQLLYYLYQNLCDRAAQAQLQLKELDTKLNEALSKVHQATAAGDVNNLSWGAAQLSTLRGSMDSSGGEWTDAQLREVEKHLALARVETQKRFPSWLPHQKPPNLAQLADWLRHLRRVADNLGILDLPEEKAALEQHSARIEENTRFLDQVSHLQSDIAIFTRTNKATASTTLHDIRTWLEEAENHEKTLAEARLRKVDVAIAGLDAAAAQLASFKEACRQHEDQIKDRALRVYNAEIKSLGDIRDLQAEVATVRQLFVGQEEDLNDLGMVGRQLNDLEADYRRLDHDDLTNSEFEARLKQCIAAMEQKFAPDKPPLDNELCFEGISQAIRARRRRDAEDWICRSIPQLERVQKARAEEALDLKARLQAMPKFLTQDQKNVARKAIVACDDRIDQLAVDGLVAKYEALPEASKRSFLRRIGQGGA